MTSIHERAVARLHAWSAELPETVVGITVHHPSIKLKDKGFVMYVGTDRYERPALWIKAAPGVLGELLAVDPERFFKPPYVGSRGWVGVWLTGTTDWAECEELVVDAYRLVAPKRLVAQLDAQPEAVRLPRRAASGDS